MAMSDFLSRFHGGELIGLVAVVGGLLCGIVSIIGHFWHENRETALKRDMVERGMSAEEIQAVLYAGAGRKPKEIRDRRSSRV
jgi:hypothetical protein